MTVFAASAQQLWWRLRWGAFIAFWVPMGRVEGPARGRALPTVYHRLRRSGRSPALPYPPSRHCQCTSCGTDGQAPHRYPQSGKRTLRMAPARDTCARTVTHPPANKQDYINLQLAGPAHAAWECLRKMVKEKRKTALSREVVWPIMHDGASGSPRLLHKAGTGVVRANPCSPQHGWTQDHAVQRGVGGQGWMISGGTVGAGLKPARTAFGRQLRADLLFSWLGRSLAGRR